MRQAGVNVRAWFAAFCQMATNETIMSYDVDWVRVYQRAGGISVSCDPLSHPTRLWIAGHAPDYKLPNQLAPLGAVVAGGGECATSSDCGAPHGTCEVGQCTCISINVTGPTCQAQVVGASSQCRTMEDNASRQTQPCAPPATYNTTWLNLLLHYTCTSSNASDAVTGACASVGASMAELHTCSHFEGTSDWTACAEMLGHGCSAYARAAHVLAASQQLPKGGSSEIGIRSPLACCNSFYFDAAGGVHVACFHLSPPAPPGVLQYLDASAQGVVYAPVDHGADPLRKQDIYSGRNLPTFRRDARVLHQLGATTLLLEPWLDDTLHTPLFEAMRFANPPDLGALEAEEAAERADWPTINLVPTIDVEASELNLYTGLSVPDMLRSVCERTKRAVAAAIEPDGPYDDKSGIQGFNLNVRPNDVNKWTAPNDWTPWLDYWDQPYWNIFLPVQQMAACAKEVLYEAGFRGAGGTPPLILLSIVDPLLTGTNFNSTAVGFLHVYEGFLRTVGQAPHVDGIIVHVNRARVCSAETLVSELRQKAARFGAAFRRPLRLWFSVGVDAYNDAQRAPYETVKEESRSTASIAKDVYEGTVEDRTTDALFADARTACLLELVESVNLGCNTTSQVAAAATSGALESVHNFLPPCGLLIHEYTDSLWRAAYAGPTDATNTLGQVCRASSRDDSPGSAAPQANSHYLTQQLSCGEYAPCGELLAAPSCVESLSLGSAPRLPQQSRLPLYLRCHESGTIDDVSGTPSCAPADTPLVVDTWHNVAWDGLMERAYDGLWACKMAPFDDLLSLRPRRAFYFMQQLWAPADSSALRGAAKTTLVGEWPVSLSMIDRSRAAEARFFARPFEWTLAWVGIFIGVMALCRGIFHRTGIAGRWSVFLSLTLAFVLSSLVPPYQIPLPCVVGKIVSDLMCVALFVLLWCPLNGGSGSGSWWWVHLFVIFVCAEITGGAYLGDPSDECSRGFFTGPLASVLQGFLQVVLPSGASAPGSTPPPWDVCRSATCCVLHANATAANFFPWSSQTAVPDAWEPFVPWVIVIQLLFLSLVLTVGLCCFGCATLQVAWLLGPRGSAYFRRWRVRRRVKNARRPAMARNPDPPIEVAMLEAHIADARRAIEATFGDHFQRSALDNTEDQLLCLLRSRARRLHGASFADDCMNATDASAAFGVPEATESGKGQADNGALEVTSLLTSACRLLDPATRLPLSEAADLWRDLTANLNAWLPRHSGFRPEHRTSLVAQMLLKHGRSLRRMLDLGVNDHFIEECGNAIQLAAWEIPFLLLLVGAEGWYRAMPDAINLLFAAHACELLEQRAQAATTANAAVVSPSSHRRELSNLRSSLYELHKRTGGKLGHRIPDVLSEKFATFDDIDELCAAPQLHILTGVAHLVNTLATEVQAIINWGVNVSQALDSPTSALRSAVSHLERSVQLFRCLSKYHASSQESPNNGPDEASPHRTHRVSSLARTASLLRPSRASRRSIRPTPSDPVQLEMVRLRNTLPTKRHAGPSSWWSWEGRQASSPDGVVDASDLVHASNAALEEEMAAYDLTPIARAAHDNVPFETGVQNLLVSMNRLLTCTQSTASDVSDAAGSTAKSKLTQQLHLLHEELAKLTDPAEEAHATPNVAALARLATEARDVMQNAGLGPCVEALGARTRFTWGDDRHKTFEERRGYEAFLRETYFLWSVLALLVFALLGYESGGYVNWAVGIILAAVMGAPPAWLRTATDALDAAVFRKLPGQELLQQLVGHDFAPNWLRYHMMLLVSHVLLQLLGDVMRLRRAVFINSASEHWWWAMSTRITWKMSIAAQPSSHAAVRTPQHTPRPAARRSAYPGATVVVELLWLLSPLISVLSVLCMVPCTAAVKLAARTAVWRLGSDRDESAVSAMWHAALIVLRISYLVLLGWLYNGIESNYNGSRPGEVFDTTPGRAFLFLGFVHAWACLLGSVAHVLFSRVPPRALVAGCLPARLLFGFFYDFFEPPWQRFLPREQRSAKALTVASVFWVITLGIKAVFGNIELSSFTRTLHQLLYSALVLPPIEAYVASVVLVLRVSFTALFFIADLQLIFAGVIAAFGGVSAAVSSMFGQLGTLWDRRRLILSEQLHSVASGLTKTAIPVPVSAHYDGLYSALTAGEMELDLLSRLWNEGLLVDMYESHLIDAATVQKLRFSRTSENAPQLPPLEAIVPHLCADARRRIHAFCSFGQRTVGVPVAPMPIHMPSLTVLVPVYGETVIRSWHQMHDTGAVGAVCNLEYMASSRSHEFYCLSASLPPDAREILKPFVTGSADGIEVCDRHGLRDRLWFSDYLLITIKSGAAVEKSGTTGGDSAAARVARVVLDAAILDAAPGAPADGGSRLATAAPIACGHDVMVELPHRVALAREAAELQVTCLDELVDILYSQDEALAQAGAAWTRLAAVIAERCPQLSPSAREPALLALGVTPEQAWVAAESATPLCREVRRICLEARLKLSLRLWFSNREQSVWRTLCGLAKAETALRMLQAIASAAICGAAKRAHITPPAAPELPPDAVHIVAALQNYGGWRSGRLSLLAKCEKLLSELRLAASSDNEAGGMAKAHELRSELQGANKLLVMHDQCAAVALLLHQYPQLRIVSLQAAGAGRCRSVLTMSAPPSAPQGVASLSDLQEVQPHDVGDRKVDVLMGPCGEVARLVETRAVELPGNPIIDGLAEGKPANQASALLHVTCEVVMVNDCNQGADLEQWFFLPRLLQEFHNGTTSHQKPTNRVRIVGFRENIFTEADGIVGYSGALNEHVFGTIIQRQLHRTLNARLHYGHPDCFDFAFVLCQGGTSKMSKGINVSEDIFGGINVFRRGGLIRYVDYIQIDKGRDVQFDAALDFEGKIAGGTSMHAHSRDFHRLMSSPLSWFHRLSLFSGSLGLFVSNTAIVRAIHVLACLHATAALLPLSAQHDLYQSLPAYHISLFNLGMVYLFALVIQTVDERGVREALRALLATFAVIPLALCKMAMHAHYVHRGVALGIARYMPTGRDLATKRVGFVTIFTRYSHSHFQLSLDILYLLAVFGRYTLLGGDFYMRTSFTLYLVALSLMLGPALFNPFAFTLTGLQSDARVWVSWLNSSAFHEWRLGGVEQGKRSVNFIQNHWFTWLNLEPPLLRLSAALWQLALYGAIAATVGLKLVGGAAHQSTAQHRRLQSQLVFVTIIGLLLYAAHVRLAVVRLALLYALGVFAFSSVFGGSGIDLILFPCACLKCSEALLKLWLLGWRFVGYPASPPAAAAVTATAAKSAPRVASTELLVWPQSLPLLICNTTATAAKFNAMCQGVVYLGVSAIIGGMLCLPLVAIAAFAAIASMLVLITSTVFTPQPETLMLRTGIVLSGLVPTVLGWLLLRDRTVRRGVSALDREKSSLLQVSLGTFHHWFVMNASVARLLVDK